MSERSELIMSTARTWRAWVARVPDPVLGARSVGARARLFVAALTVLVAAGDPFVVGPLVPGLMGSMRMAPDRLPLGLTPLSGFAIAAWATMPLADALLGALGLRRQMVCALALWTTGAVIAAAARGPEPLSAGRALQGAAAGLLVPTTLAMVRSWWPPERRGAPRALVVGAVVVASALGTYLATTLRLWSSWRLVFRVEALVGVVLCALFVHFDDPRDRHGRPRLDPLGVVLVWLGLAVGFLLAVHHGRRVWPAVLLLIGIVAAALWRDLHSPLDRRRVLAVREFADRGGFRVLATVVLRGTAGGLLVAGCGALRSPTIGWRGVWPGLSVAAGAGLLLVDRAQRRGRRVPDRGIAGLAAAAAGAALGVLVVYLPLFNLATRNPHTASAGAWVVLRAATAFTLVIVVGALLLRWGAWVVVTSGFLCAVVGLVAMSQWGPGSLRGTACWPALLAVGGGLGLTAAPAGIVADWWLGIGVGVPLLTARGLAVFRDRMHGVRPPIELCPTGPGQCAEYERAVRGAVLDQFRAVFLGSALCAALAATVVVLSALMRAPRWTS